MLQITKLFSASDAKLNPYMNEWLPYIQYQFAVPILRKITTIALIGLICNLVISVIYFISNWDIHYFVKIAHTQCMELFSAVCLCLGLSTSHLGPEIAGLMKILWPHNDLGSEVSMRIKKKYKLLQIARVIITVLSLLIGVICIPLSGDNGELAIFSNIKGDMVIPIIIHLPLLIIIVFGKLYLSYAIISINFTTLFVINDITSHMLLLRKKLQSISKLYGEEEENYYDESYQRYINEILRNCIDQHKNILKYAKIVTAVLDKALLVVTSLGILCLTFLYIEAKMVSGLRFIINCVSTQVITVIVTCSYCNSGQLLIDECEKLHRDLCECPWILWNKSNKAKYQIFLLHSREPIVIKNLGLILNNNLIVLVLQKVLSFMAFIEQVTAKP